MPGPSYTVHVSASGNVFMREIAQLLVAALGDLGRDAELLRDELPIAAPGHIDLVVAPHEFFTLLDGVGKERRRAIARRVICLGTEQPGTPWFELSAAWAAAGPLALDINPMAVRALRRRRIDAHLLRLGYHESWDQWNPGAPRPTDVLFLGALTERRDAMLASFGGVLSGHECDLRLFGFERPVDETTPAFLTGGAKYERLATSKLLLNIHRSEVPYFEWMRALEAIANGCVLVTEPASGHEPLVPSEHLVIAEGRGLLHWVETLLTDEARRAEIADGAHQLVRTELHFTRMLEQELPALEQAIAGGRSHRRLPDVQTVARNQGRVAAATARALAVRSRNGVLRRIRGTREESGDLLNAELAHQVKQVALANRRVERRLEALEIERRHGDPDHLEVRSSGAYAAFEPDITVVIPLFDYQDSVGAAVDSVLASRGVNAELLIVDDHSRDDSLAVVERKLEDNDGFPMAVIAKQANAGLSAARNTGFERARADRVFLLDADNTVYQDGLRKLSDALDADRDAAFTYGIVERFGDESSLISALPWDPARLAEGNYIDAMALVRVDAWRKAGGYDPEIDGRFGGWEDYEFWLHLAALGLYGALVPQVVARYRKHTGSMLALLNLETESVRGELRNRYPELPWPAPILS